MRTTPWAAAAAVLLCIPVGAAAQQVATRDTKVGGGQSVEVLRAGTGSFNSYLKQAAPVPAPTVGTAVTPVVVPVVVPSIPVPEQPQFVLHRGQLVHTELQAWAKSSGWQLLWLPDVSWKVLGDTNLSNFTDVTLAVSEVIGVLRDEGRAVRLNIADGNRIMEVISTDVVTNREMASE